MLKITVLFMGIILFFTGCGHQEPTPTTQVEKNKSTKMYYEVKPKLSHSFYY